MSAQSDHRIRGLERTVSEQSRNGAGQWIRVASSGGGGGGDGTDFRIVTTSAFTARTDWTDDGAGTGTVQRVGSDGPDGDDIAALSHYWTPITEGGHAGWAQTIDGQVWIKNIDCNVGAALE